MSGLNPLAPKAVDFPERIWYPAYRIVGWGFNVIPKENVLGRERVNLAPRKLTTRAEHGGAECRSDFGA